MVARHGPAAPEDIEQPVLFYAPGGQVGGPAGTAFYLDFYLCKEERQYADKAKTDQEGPE